MWLVLEDVTELRRLQQIRAEFIDNLSHELRTPLTTVSLLAETLTREADAAGDAIPAKMKDRIGKIEIETGHLVQMVNELLDLTRIESGGPMLLLDDVDMGRLAVASVERLRLFADRQGVTLASDVPAAVPAVRGDEDRLGQVIVNLVHNAVKFSPAGRTVTVRVSIVDADRRDGRRGPRDRHPARHRSGASSSASTRSTGPACGAVAGRDSGSRSPATSSSSTAGGSGSSRRTGSARRSSSPCRSRPPPTRTPPAAAADADAADADAAAADPVGRACPGGDRPMTTTERPTLRLAHRGDHGTHPENTIAAFVAAMADPACDGVEFDVHLSRDGVPV